MAAVAGRALIDMSVASGDVMSSIINQEVSFTQEEYQIQDVQAYQGSAHL